MRDGAFAPLYARVVRLADVRPASEGPSTDPERGRHDAPATNSEQVLLWVGLLGLAVAALLLGIAAVVGSHVPPEGSLTKSAHGQAMLALVVLTSRALLRRSELSRTQKRLWRTSLVASALFSYVFSPVQHARGLNPRFSDFWASTDHALSVAYFLTSQCYSVLFAALAWSFFRSVRPSLPTLAMRYGLVSAGVGCVDGYWMLLDYQGRYVGRSGDAVMVHSLAFAGLVGFVLLAIGLERSRRAGQSESRLLHAQGSSWLVSLGLVLLHVRLDQRTWQASLPLLLAWLCQAWLAVGLIRLWLPPLARAIRGKQGAERSWRRVPLLSALLLGSLAPSLALSSAGLHGAEREAAWSAADVLTLPERRVRGVDFVRLPAAKLVLGCVPGDTRCGPDEVPHPVELAGFWMATTEVSVTAYSRCVEAGHCQAPSSRLSCRVWQPSSNEPVNCVSWQQASDFCSWLGARLPSADEWEYAAKAGQSSIYPWGNGRAEIANARFGGLFQGPVAVDSGNPNRFGLLHMADNVREWTQSRYDDRSMETRGGSWNGSPASLRSSNRAGSPPHEVGHGLGIRCAMDDR